jgi:hypothetical protein
MVADSVPPRPLLHIPGFLRTLDLLRIRDLALCPLMCIVYCADCGPWASSSILAIAFTVQITELGGNL